jgi:bacillolysin
MNRHSRGQISARLVVGLLSFAIHGALRAQPLEPQEISGFLLTLVPESAPGPQAVVAQGPEAPRLGRTADGFLRYVGAPPGEHFAPTAQAALLRPETVARDFLLQNNRMFGLRIPGIDFRLKRNRPGNGRSHVRLQQLYQNIPVIAAETVVQVDAEGGVECVLNDLATESEWSGAGGVSLTPQVSADAAALVARMAFPAVRAEDIRASTPELAVLAPSVLDEPGDPALVWDLEVSCDTAVAANARVLVSARDGRVLRVWSTTYGALNRMIYDAGITTNDPGTLVRPEGGPLSAIPDANNAYDYLGDTYNFYYTVHNRDSLDGNGLTLSATVRYCAPNGSGPPSCPPQNLAFFAGNQRMYFGAGYVADDVTAHELTHGVTASESGLLYTNASGAINESFSDVWGETVDLGNGKGTDTDAVKWLIGEDIPGGAIRSMTNPPAFGDPDRLFSPLYQAPTNTFDNGGVHKNSGVNNKLYFLLADDVGRTNTFNGQTIDGMGTTKVIKLYYEVQVNLLTSAAGWTELYYALSQAAVNLNWGIDDRNNLYRACVAVEIAAGRDLYVDNTSICGVPVGLPGCVFSLGPYVTVGQGVSGAYPGDILHIRVGNYNEPMTVTKALSLQAENGLVNIGQ